MLGYQLFGLFTEMKCYEVFIELELEYLEL